jgi:predicted RNA-binding protein with PUA-like domain
VAYFLAKTEPDSYSIDDLARDGETVWDGVRNAQAVGVIKVMCPGDIVLIYHSGGASAIVGVAEVVSAPRPDVADEKSTVVDVRFRAKLDQPVTLREVKASGRFADFVLVRQSRLSTMAVPDEFVAWLRRERGAAIP